MNCENIFNARQMRKSVNQNNQRCEKSGDRPGNAYIKNFYVIAHRTSCFYYRAHCSEIQKTRQRRKRNIKRQRRIDFMIARRKIMPELVNRNNKQHGKRVRQSVFNNIAKFVRRHKSGCPFRSGKHRREKRNNKKRYV